MLLRWRHLCSIAAAPLLAAAVALLAPVGRAAAAEGAHHFHVPTFDIPISWGQTGQYKQATLYVSTNGQRFVVVNTVPAGTATFSYTAPADGRYFFVLQLEDLDGKRWPEQVTADDISLKVFVDRKAPKITLRPTAPQQGTVAVVWKIEDEGGVDLASIRLDYSPKGRQEWTNVPITPLDYAQRSWAPTGAGPFDVRLTARDRAGNPATATTRVAASASRTGFPSPPGLAARQEQHVNRKKFNLDYKFDKVGPSRIKNVEIYFTTDTKTWTLLRSDAPVEGGPVVIDAKAEGLYGFTVRPVNGVGKGPEAPRAWQEPQIWVRVDETKPVVTLKGVSDGSDGTTQIISWSASDDHLRDKPITIYTSTDRARWTVLKEGLENTGTYTHPAKDLPDQFYVRVEAVDKAGNKGVAETAELVKVDMSVPEVKGVKVSVGESKPADQAPPAGAPALPGG